MGNTNREEAEAAEGQEALGYPILALPGVIGNRYWSELAEEAQIYIELLGKLKRTATDAIEREALEDEMISSLSHLAMHSSVLYGYVDEAIENSDEIDGDNSPQVSTRAIAPVNTQIEESSEDETVEEGGFVDFLVEGQEATEKITAFLQNTVDSTQDLTLRITRYADEINKLNKGAGQGSVQGARLIIHKAADTLNAHCDEVETNLPHLDEQINLMMDNLGKFAMWLRGNQGESKEAAERYRQSISELLLAVQSAMESLTQYRKSVINLQGISKDMSKASRRLANMLKQVLESLEKLQFSSNELLLLFEE